MIIEVAAIVIAGVLTLGVAVDIWSWRKLHKHWRSQDARAQRMDGHVLDRDARYEVQKKAEDFMAKRVLRELANPTWEQILCPWCPTNPAAEHGQDCPVSKARRLLGV